MNNYNTYITRFTDKIRKNNYNTQRRSRTSRVALHDLLQTRRPVPLKRIASAIQREDPSGLYKKSFHSSPLLRKLAYGTVHMSAISAAPLQIGGASVSCVSTRRISRPRGARRGTQAKKDEGGGSSGDDGPCPDPDIDQIKKPLRGCRHVRGVIERVDVTHMLSYYYTLPRGICHALTFTVIYFTENYASFSRTITLSRPIFPREDRLHVRVRG